MTRTATMFVTVATIGALTIAAPALAAQAKTQSTPSTANAAKPAAAKPAAAKPAATKAAPKATALVTTGSIVRYDAASSMLVVSTAQGEQSFALTSSPRIQDGTKTVAAADLSKLTGRSVQVRYTEDMGKKNVESVRVQKAAMKGAPAKTTAKSGGKK
jgi:hypothetical protein